MTRRGGVLLALTLALAGATAHAAVDLVEDGVTATLAERFARHFQLPLGAYYTWLAQNPQSASPPTYTELQPHMFAPGPLPGYSVVVTSVDADTARLCVTAQMVSRLDASGFAAGAQRAGAELVDPATCLPDAGAAVRASALPRVAAMARVVDRRRVLSVPALPPQPFVGLPPSGFVDLRNASPIAMLSVTNNTAGLLVLTDASVADSAFVVGSDCQAGVDPGASCAVEVALAGALGAKRVARVQLSFSNGATAWFSLRGTP